MLRRSFIKGLSLFLLAVNTLSAPARRFKLVATISPPLSGIPLTFTFGTKSVIANTDANGQASVVFKGRTGNALVSGYVQNVYVSDSVQVAC